MQYAVVLVKIMEKLQGGWWWGGGGGGGSRCIVLIGGGLANCKSETPFKALWKFLAVLTGFIKSRTPPSR